MEARFWFSADVILTVQQESLNFSQTTPDMSRFILFFVAPVFLAGCATTLSSQESSYERKLGTATSQEAESQIWDTLVNRYGYVLERRVSTESRKYFVTEWKRHTPNTEEQMNDIQSCRTRLTVQARPSDRSGDGVRSYRVYFEAEYQVQREDADWERIEMGEARKAYVEDIAVYLERKFKSGVKEL